MKNKGNHRLLEILRSEGINLLFGNPGTTELAIMEAIGSQKYIKYILGLQESIVVAMADGYARASGQLSAANVHVAPGLGNAMGSLYNAKFYGSPIILTAGQQEIGHGLMEPMLYDSLVPIASPLVKWAFEVQRVQDLERVVRRAAKIALTPPTGPVFISLPGDILDDQIDTPIGNPTRVNTNTRPSDDVLDNVAERILISKSPIIIAGHELATRNALNQAGELAILIGSPVWQQTVPHGAHFCSEHDCFQGHLSRNQEQVKNILVKHDLLIFLGSDILRMSVMSETDPLPENIDIVHITERTWELGKNYPTEFAIGANVRDTIDALIPKIKLKQTDSHLSIYRTRLEKIKNTNWKSKKNIYTSNILNNSNSLKLSPEYLMMLIAKNLPSDAVVVEEGLSSTQTLLNFLTIKHRNQFFGLASGGIGFATAGAIGISLALPDRPIIAIIGDGSIMYSIQALWTAAHLTLPITYLVLNNGGYEILKQRLKAFRGVENYVGMELMKPAIDFAILAKSMGVPGVKVENSQEICNLLKNSSTRPGPLLIEIKVDRSLS